MDIVTKNFGGKCKMPDCKETVAKLTEQSPGDFETSNYDISISCHGNDGLATVSMGVEFSQLNDPPWNLDLIM